MNGAPIHEIAKYRRVTIDSSKLLEGPYSGNPGPGVDGAWDELLSSKFAFMRRILS